MVDGRSIKLFTTAVIIILFKSTEVNKYEIIQADSLKKQKTCHDSTNGFPQNDVWETSAEIRADDDDPLLPRSGYCFWLVVLCH